jgi:hypothetical protein
MLKNTFVLSKYFAQHCSTNAYCLWFTMHQKTLTFATISQATKLGGYKSEISTSFPKFGCLQNVTTKPGGS